MGNFRLQNLSEKIKVDISVAEAKGDFFGNVFSIFGAKKEPERVIGKNQVDIQVYKKMGTERVVFTNGKGNYARYLEINNKIYYPNPKMDYSIWIVETKKDQTIPSSSIMRKDILLLMEGKTEEAEK